MAVTTRGPAGPAIAMPPESIAMENKTPPVMFWAAAGAFVVAFVTYVLIKWVSGPYFETVPDGPSDPTTLMSALLIFWQVISIPTALFLLYWFVVRPWRRDGHVGVDGMLVIGGSFMWFQDPISSFGQHWFVYNTEMLNFGSWANDIPGWTSFGEPGAMTSEPILFTPAAYMYIMLIGAAIGCFVMRRAKRRWPNISTAGLVAVCFFAMMLFDVVLEGLIWLPMGVFEYPGGHLGIFPDTYHKYPLNEMFTMGVVFTTLASLRFFVNDRGETVIERGIDKVKGGKNRKILLRGLAFIAFMQITMFVGYNIPNSVIATNSTAWPEDLQKRSYFTNYLCGDTTDRPCPGPGVSNTRDGSAYVNLDGEVTNPPPDAEPPGYPLPEVVPFDIGKPGPEE